MKTITLVVLLLGWMFGAQAATPPEATPSTEKINSDFDSLSGNQNILEKARELQGDVRIQVVQERLVPRRLRFEVSTELGSNMGGTTYTKTDNYGLNLHFHITPRWSIGAKYNTSFNGLTAEGESVIRAANADLAANPGDPRVLYPELDYQKSQTLGLVNWYPFYGKINVFDRVAQFDIYGLVGAGTVEMASGSQSTWTTGAGAGIWWTPRLATRLEARYQTFKATYYDGPRDVNVAVGSLQVGWLL